MTNLNNSPAQLGKIRFQDYDIEPWADFPSSVDPEEAAALMRSLRWQQQRDATEQMRYMPRRESFMFWGAVLFFFAAFVCGALSIWSAYK